MNLNLQMCTAFKASLLPTNPLEQHERDLNPRPSDMQYYGQMDAEKSRTYSTLNFQILNNFFVQVGTVNPTFGVCRVRIDQSVLLLYQKVNIISKVQPFQFWLIPNVMCTMPYDQNTAVGRYARSRRSLQVWTNGHQTFS